MTDEPMKTLLANADVVDDPRPTREELYDRKQDHMKDDPTLTEVLEVFDPDELYVMRSRRSNLQVKWNQHDNRYMDDAVWSHLAHEGRVPRWVYELFEHVGIEKR